MPQEVEELDQEALLGAQPIVAESHDARSQDALLDHSLLQFEITKGDNLRN